MLALSSEDHTKIQGPHLSHTSGQTECGNRIESSRSISVVGKKQSQRQEEMGLNWKNRRDVCFLKFLIFRRRYNQDKKERKSQILQEDWPRNQNLARNILPETSTAHKT